jgi:gliding motility-associated-like protein
MNTTRLRWIFILCFAFAHTVCFAQKPSIQQVDKVAGSNGEVVTLQGTFVNDATRMQVSFGASKGTVQFLSDQLIEVKVPYGTTYDNIVVTDKTSGLSDRSDAPFLLSFGGNHGVTAASLEGQIDFNSESGLYDLCTCDFDGDGRVDVASANDGANTLDVFANTTPLPGLANISFNRIPFLIGARSIHAKCGDLNGDGKPDLLVSEGGSNGDRIFIFRNTSTGAGVFTFSISTVSLTGKKVKRIDIADLDNDGKPEAIVTNQTGNNVTVLVNQSTTASIAFAASQITLTIAGAASTDGLAVEDLDGDGLPEIATSQFLTQTSNIFILKNTSVPGNVSFGAPQTISISGTVVNLKAGDLDGDNKPEIVATQLIGTGTISVFKNQSSGSPSFAPAVTFATAVRPWGLDLGDIDGDGKPDIVVSSLEKFVTVLNNESTSSGFAFSTLTQSTTYINRHVGVADLDSDGKPDIVFTSVDDNNNAIPASKISVFRNKSCLVPVIDPAGPVTICSGFPLQLNTMPSNGVTYVWKNGGATLVTGTDPFYDVSATGAYTVTVTGEAGSCSETSNTVSVTVDPGTTTGTATPVNDGPVCAGSTLNLSVNDVGATAYNWTGPAGYTGTGLNPASIPNFQSVNAGRYNLDVVVNGCIAQQASTVAQIIGLPDFQVSYTGTDIICPPDTKTLTLVPNNPDFTYQWSERTTGDISGATGTTLNVSASGKYFVKAKYTPNPACAAVETEDVTITFSTAPVADFSAPATACTSEVISFTNQSTGDASATRLYDWAFGDGQASTLDEPTHQYASANSYSVTLKVSYTNGACQNQTTKNITIQNAPPASITTAGGSFDLCTGDTLQLDVSGTFNSYQWSTGELTPSILVTLPGFYSVDVSNGTCIITATVNVDSVAGPQVSAMADPAEINEGGSSQLNATGLSVYQWTPAETLSDGAIAGPIATPLGTTVYTVRGTDANGCPGIDSVEVVVKGDLIINKLGPSKFISPDNGDAINNFWIVERILDYPQCSVTIYDDKGVKVYEAKPYNNDWDGTYRGKQLPDGVYYYVIRCDGEEGTPKAGSITVLR